MNKQLLIVLLFISQVFTSFSQNSPGEKEYNSMAYSRAAAKLERVVKANPRDFKSYDMLANCYRLNNELKKAEETYRWIYNTGLANADQYFYYAQVLIENGNLKEAKKVLQKFSEYAPKDIRWKNMINGLSDAEKSKKEEPQYKVLKTTVCSEGSDFAPVIYNDGIVFVSNRVQLTLMEKNDAWTGQNYFRLYEANGKEAVFNTPHAMFSEIQQVRNDGPVCFNKDFTVMYWTSNSLEPKKEGEKKKTQRLKIYRSVWENGKWVFDDSFDWNSDAYSCAHPAISPDENTMYFSSDMPGGRGGMDIWKCTYNGESWSQPVNLGPQFNTNGNEVFPTTNFQGELFFASNGLKGFGGLDLFKSTLNVYGDLNEPQNLGSPLNSKEDDFSISWSLNNDYGYFSSNREGKGPNDEVFYFSKIELEKKDSLNTNADSTSVASSISDIVKQKYVTLKGRVFNSDDNSALVGQSLLLVNLQSGESISIKTDENGNYQVGNLKQEIDYELTTLKVNCGDVKKQFNTFFQNESSEMIVDIPVYCLDDVIILRNIYYDYDKWEIRDDAALELNKLAELMRIYPTMRIELSSHTDARGDDLYNYALSRNRANSAVDYLISLGIDSSRLVAKGYGESRLLNRCGNDEECTEMEHEENRRTEFKILYIESNNPMNTSGMTITR